MTQGAVATRAESLELIEVEVRALVRRIKRVIAGRAAEVHPELQPASFLILGWLAEHGPARGSSLAGEFGIDKGAISRQVQHLVELGLVIRSADPEDGRAMLLAASEEARVLLERAELDRRRAWGVKLADWSEEELRLFAAQLTRFNRDLD